MKHASLHHVSSGPAAARTLLLLHGFMGSSKDWETVVHALTPGIRCLAVDLPGHGRSLDMEASSYSYEGSVNALASLLEKEAQPVEVVGYSMGGRLALALALKCPDRVKRVLLESASAGLAGAAARAARVRHDEGWARRLECEPLEQVLHDWYAQEVFAALDRQAGLREALAEERARGSGREYARALRGMGLGRQPSFHRDLTGCSVPLRWMAGEHDPKFSATARAMADLSPHADAVIVPNAGHTPHREQPGAFLRELTRWLDSSA